MGLKEDVQNLFADLDKDKSGKVSAAELKAAVETNCGMKVEEKEVKEFLETLDTNKDGELSLEEVLAFFNRKEAPAT